MAWTSPRTWVAGELVTASLMNTYVRDEFSYLKDSPTFDGDVTVTGTATITGSASVTGALTVTSTLTTNKAVLSAVVALTDGATPALDASLGNLFTLIAAGDRTIAVPSNATTGQKIVIRHLASGGARTLALNSGAGGFRFGSDIPALTQTASGKIDYVGCIYNATDSKWDVIGYTKGF